MRIGLTQKIYSTSLVFTHTKDESHFDNEEVRVITESLLKTFTNGYYNCIEHTEIYEEYNNSYLLVQLGLYNDSYYDIECTCDGYDLEGTYENVSDLFEDLYHCPSGYEYEIIDWDMDSIDDLWEEYYDDPEAEDSSQEHKDEWDEQVDAEIKAIR